MPEPGWPPSANLHRASARSKASRETDLRSRCRRTFLSSWGQSPNRLSTAYRLLSGGVATVRDSGLELSTRLHCTHVIVPLLRDPAEDETSRERGEQSVRPRHVDVERHFEPSTFRVREQPVRIMRVPHVRSGVGLPTVRRSQAYKEPRGEREPHGSGLFHFDQGSLPTEHMACAQPDSAQFGVTIPKFRAPRIDIRKRGSKPLRYSEEHARRIHLRHKKGRGEKQPRGLPLLDAPVPTDDLPIPSESSNR